MLWENSVVYCYDGSFDGLLCCVFESFSRKEYPVAIECADSEKDTIFRRKIIETDAVKANRVKVSIPGKISLEAAELVEEAFLSNLFEKELHILSFLSLGYRVGSAVTDMNGDEHVRALKGAVMMLSREAHYITGTLTFSDYGGLLMAQISPKNNVLPVITPHYCEKMPGQDFMIFDRSHHVAFICRDGIRRYFSSGRAEIPPLGPEEKKYRSLWKNFFEEVSLEGTRSSDFREAKLPYRMRNT